MPVAGEAGHQMDPVAVLTAKRTLALLKLIKGVL
jgi:hypothetical protein